VQRYGGWITPADMAGACEHLGRTDHRRLPGVRLYECPPNGQGLAAIIAANLVAGYDLAA
jgi:gamma-glutamyltranspeptidase/glutathione hydrolase